MLSKINTEIMYTYLTIYNQLYEKFNISIYACGGTLLGAIREKNFISYDNDIDYFIIENDISKIIDDTIIKFINNFDCSLFIEKTDFYNGCVYHIIKSDTIYTEPKIISDKEFKSLQKKYFISDIFLYEKHEDHINIKMKDSAPTHRKNQKIKPESLKMTQYPFGLSYIYSIKDPHYYLSNVYKNYMIPIKTNK